MLTPPWKQFLTERQIKETEFAIHYAANYGHGTSGHLGYMTIAALAMIIEKMAAEGTKGPLYIITEETLKEYYAISGNELGRTLEDA